MVADIRMPDYLQALHPALIRKMPDQHHGHQNRHQVDQGNIRLMAREPGLECQSGQGPSLLIDDALDLKLLFLKVHHPHPIPWLVGPGRYFPDHSGKTDTVISLSVRQSQYKRLTDRIYY